MKTITHQQFLNFIFSQPREREVDMMDNMAREGDCGCMMVQYGREQGLKGVIVCGFHDIGVRDKEPDFYLEKSISDYFPNWRRYTYGEIQDYCAEKFKITNP